jgi:hypothetical protein
MITAVSNVKMNNSYAVSFKGYLPNDGRVILPSDPKAREIYLDNNREVAEGGLADGNISLPQLLARRIVSFYNLVTQDPQIERESKDLERQIREVVKDDNASGSTLNTTA